MSAQADRDDYRRFISDLWLRQDLIDVVMAYTEDLIETPECRRFIDFGVSKIHGVGLFAKEDIANGSKVGPSRINGKRCVAGRFMNHSGEANSIVKREGDSDLIVYAVHDIARGEEITINYRQVADVNHELKKAIFDIYNIEVSI